MMKTTFLGRREVPKEIKTEIVKKVVKLTILYSSDSWILTKRQEQLLRIVNVSRLNKIRNETIRHNLQIEPIDEKIIEGQQRWFGHVCRMPESRLDLKRECQVKTKKVDLEQDG